MYTYLYFPEPSDKLQTDRKTFYPKILQCVFPKSKDILLYNHNTVVRIRTLILV